MEQCLVKTGVVLLQRSSSTAYLAGRAYAALFEGDDGSPTLPNSSWHGSLSAAANLGYTLSQSHQSPISNLVSPSNQSTQLSLLKSQPAVQAQNFLSPSFAASPFLATLVHQYSQKGGIHLPNVTTNVTNTTFPNKITTYEQSRHELGSVLFLNLGFFVLGLFVWAVISPCMQELWRRREVWVRSREDSELASEAPAGPEVTEVMTPVQVQSDTPKRNYLLYMLICMYTCVVLSLVNICFLALHGLVGKVMFGGWSILMVLGKVSFAEIYFIIAIDGIIVLVFSELWEHLIEVPEKDNVQDRMRRTVWFQGLPTHDTVHWWRQFQLNELEVSRVKHDLMEALTDVLYMPSQNSGVAFGTRRQEIAEGGSTPPLPSDRPPVDLQTTQWRCYLDGGNLGNPYYVNASNGVTQWQWPAELVSSVRHDSPIVEEIYVAVVIDKWLEVHTALLQSREYLEAYEAKLEKAQSDLLDETQPYACQLLAKPASWWYAKKIAALRPRIETLSRDLMSIRKEKKFITGSAFVTFKHPRHRDMVLQETEQHPVSSSLWARSHSYFSFGRPPFASVTLSCERAPHPSDVIWQNLHITWWQRGLVFWTLALLLLFVMVLIVTVVRISELVVPVILVVRKELDVLEGLPFWQDFVPDSVKSLVANVNREMIWNSILVQVPTLILLFINSVMVPAAITLIARCQRTVRLSEAEMTRMVVNFFFLFTNTVIVPFCGAASLNELLVKFLAALDATSTPDTFKDLLFASPGLFALKYLMNATFISSANQLLQVPQITARWGQQTFLSVTDRDRKSYQEPWSFHWGYWYAWTLSVFALGINMSVACPSTLPMAALFFLVKYHVDKYNLDNGVFTMGTDIEGNMAVRVVCYLRFVVALWWLAMGTLSYLIGTFEPHGDLDVGEKQYLRYGGIGLMILGVITFVCSWWLKTQHLLRLFLHVSKEGVQPSIWDEIGEALYLKRPKLQGDEISSTKSSKKKKTGEDLCWDGPKLLDLE